MCTLKLSKALMNKFHYDYIKSKYDNKSELLFTDTDSYKDFSSNNGKSDFSNYTTKSKYYNWNKLSHHQLQDALRMAYLPHHLE